MPIAGTRRERESFTRFRVEYSAAVTDTAWLCCCVHRYKFTSATAIAQAANFAIAGLRHDAGAELAVGESVIKY